MSGLDLSSRSRRTEKKDSESLDRCIQTSLSDLYPPFHATSSTVLCQVLSVVESGYRGDGLRYLFHFLLPAKKFLQSLQQHACSQYNGVLFRHEGWPLCVHEKVVIHLCPLDQRLLCPGDFYLLFSPAAPLHLRPHSASCRSGASSSPCLLVCSVPAGGRHVEQQEVLELALPSLFSMAWLDSANREREQRGASRLERCVLSANGDVFRVPWEDLVYPQFLSRARTTRHQEQKSSTREEVMSPGRDVNCSTQENVKLLPSQTGQSAASSETEDSEGEYVELTELPALPRFSPQKGSLTQSMSLQLRSRTSTQNSTHTSQNSTHTSHNTHTPHNEHALPGTHAAQNTHAPHRRHTSHNMHMPHNTHAPLNTPTPHNAHNTSEPHSAHASQNTLPVTHPFHNTTPTTNAPHNTHSSRSCLQVGSHTGLCSRLIEENFEPDSCRPIILTPLTPTSPSPPPETKDTFIILEEQQTPQEQKQGSDSVRSVTLNSEPEEEGEKMEEQEKHTQREEVMKSGKDDILVGSEDETAEREKHTAEERRADMEQEDRSEKMEGDKKLEEEGTEEVELEEEVQFTVVQQGQERKEEEEVARKEKREEEEDGEDGGEERNGQQTHTVKETDLAHCEDSEDITLHAHTKDSYSENISLQIDGPYFENTTPHIHPEDSESDAHCEDCNYDNLQHTPSEVSIVRQTLPKVPYSENNPIHLHPKDSYSENASLQTHSEVSYPENTERTHPENSHSENNKPHTHCEDCNYGNTHHTPCEEPNTLQTLCKHTQSDNTPQTHSYCENNSLQNASENIYSENSPQLRVDVHHSEAPSSQLHSEDSYFESISPQTYLKEACSVQTPSQNSEGASVQNLADSERTLLNDSDSEGPLETHIKDSNCENISTPTDSNCENIQPLSHCEESEDSAAPTVCLTTAPISEEKEEDKQQADEEEREKQEEKLEKEVEGTRERPEEEKQEEQLEKEVEGTGERPEEEKQEEQLEKEAEGTGERPEEEKQEEQLEKEVEGTGERPEEEKQEEQLEKEVEGTGERPEEEKQDEHQEEEKVENEGELEKKEDKQKELHEEERKEDRQEENEQMEKEECDGVDVSKEKTADLQTEGLSSDSSSVHSADSSPTEPQQQFTVSPETTCPTVDTHSHKHTVSIKSSFYRELLSSGALCLPGTRDRAGRALLTVSASSSVWYNPDCEHRDLVRLLLYYTSTLRKEVRALGLTVLVDARRAAPVPGLYSALRALQENMHSSIHTLLVLVNRDLSCSVRVDRTAASQVEVLSSLKSVQKYVELQQLPAELGGSFRFSQSSWLCFRSRVEQLTSQCEDVISLLQKTIEILQNTLLPAAAQDAELLLSRYKAVMRSILEDGRLVRLQQEGGASLSRLRREESAIGTTEDYRAEVEAVSSLYDQVDELLHRLVTLSNSRTQQLSFISDFSTLEENFSEVRSWLLDEGEPRLKSLNEPADSLELLNKKQTEFKEFQTTACGHCKRGEVLLCRLERWGDMSEADLQTYKAKVNSYRMQIREYAQRINSTGQSIGRALRLYSFLDKAYGWALEGMRYLAGVSMEECTSPDKCQSVIGCLEEYQSQHPPIPDGAFQEMRAEAGELRGERGLRQWNFAWSKCQETKRVFDRKMEMALKTRDSAQRRCSDPAPSRGSHSTRRLASGLRGLCESASLSSIPREEVGSTTTTSSSSSSLCNSSHQLPVSSSPITSTPEHTPQHTPLLRRLFRSSSSDVSAPRVDICSSSPSLTRLDFPSPSPSPSPSLASSAISLISSRRQHLRKTQSFDCPPTPEALRYGPAPRTLSEPAHRGNTGVFIRGLEVSSTEAADRTLCPRTPALNWSGQARSPATPSTPRTNGTSASDLRPRGSKLRHIVQEMITTEQEYVRSLQYIIHHYFPEMDRLDLPQDLRGKRSVVFGNLEKLLDFHNQFFLRELESCWKHPLRVPHCFLRHQEQFGLYALYSKNKPKSDALLANHGNSFFRRKQVELGDKMDLSSYLLKPIQRMSKYALLLSDLIKEVGVAQEAELVALQAATKMVKFQLRHGNDLLAMDAIRDCDVNLKEQGQLIRQDEFTVWSGRRKSQRHIFLFEELVLFSKPKKMEGGLDVFIYKHSFKSADVGLTQSTGDCGLRFEIWFRRRTSKNQTFTLQAANTDVKDAWTSDIARILWTQATKNKEMRLKEMVSMGVGNKPFLDIKPSDAAISDRAVRYIMKSRGARTRASIAVSVFDHSNPFKRGAVTSDPAPSGPSSSSLLGPLNLHMFSENLLPPPAADSSFITSCIEEDEQEHETGSQPSMTTESSGSSSRCLSGSTGSDSGCVSSHLQEALQEETSPLGQPHSSSSSSNKQHLNSPFISSKPAAVIGPATVV